MLWIDGIESRSELFTPPFDRGAQVITTQMAEDYEPPSAAMNPASTRADWRPAVTVERMPTEPATPPASEAIDPNNLESKNQSS